MFQDLGEVLHAGTGGEKDHNLRWPLLIDEMNQLIQFVFGFTDLKTSISSRHRDVKDSHELYHVEVFQRRRCTLFRCGASLFHRNAYRIT